MLLIPCRSGGHVHHDRIRKKCENIDRGLLILTMPQMIHNTFYIQTTAVNIVRCSMHNRLCKSPSYSVRISENYPRSMVCDCGTRGKLTGKGWSTDPLRYREANRQIRSGPSRADLKLKSVAWSKHSATSRCRRRWWCTESMFIESNCWSILTMMNGNAAGEHSRERARNINVEHVEK